VELLGGGSGRVICDGLAGTAPPAAREPDFDLRPIRPDATEIRSFPAQELSPFRCASSDSPGGSVIPKSLIAFAGRVEGPEERWISLNAIFEYDVLDRAVLEKRNPLQRTPASP
jgi:hypothetical protein